MAQSRDRSLPHKRKMQRALKAAIEWVEELLPRDAVQGGRTIPEAAADLLNNEAKMGLFLERLAEWKTLVDTKAEE